MISGILILVLFATTAFAQKYGEDVRVFKSPTSQAENELDGKIVQKLIKNLLLETPGPIKQIIDDHTRKNLDLRGEPWGNLIIPPALVEMVSARGGWFSASRRYRAVISWTDGGSSHFTYPIMAWGY